MTYNISEEVELLIKELERLGVKQDDGSYVTTFGEVFHDSRIEQMFESLVGILKAAKKQKAIDFKGEMLFQGVHDKVEIRLLPLKK
ncbi:costars family protein abracl [Anaeramoeba ignava]|uniref:Costars family protein abracl n=1 Tax=Anaeramoeba ignava TaxID=1746090 RepID=A0A9Q0L9J4_ANAIG|nr:costars family protein abracl [Anaeramoeba ignava]